MGWHARILIALLIISGCAPLQPAPALRIAANEFKARFTTFCLEPLQVPFEVNNLPAKQAQFEQLLTAELRTAQIAVISSDATTAAYERIGRARGGQFDPHTGQRNQSKHGEIRRAVMTELGCQGQLTPVVAVVMAPWVNGEADWDGVSDSLGGGFNAHGRVGALSLWVTIRDADGSEIYFNTGGIQVAAKLEGFFFQEFAHVDTATMLGDATRNAQAVATALDAVGDPNRMSAAEKRKAELQAKIREAMGRE